MKDATTCDCRVLIIARNANKPRPKGGCYRLVIEPRPFGTWTRFIAIQKKVAEALIASGMPYDRRPQ